MIHFWGRSVSTEVWLLNLIFVQIQIKEMNKWSYISQQYNAFIPIEKLLSCEPIDPSCVWIPFLFDPGIILVVSYICSKLSNIWLYQKHIQKHMPVRAKHLKQLQQGKLQRLDYNYFGLTWVVLLFVMYVE